MLSRLIPGLVGLILLVTAAQAQGPPVSAAAVPARSGVAPGDHIPVAITIEYGPGYHSWPNKPVLPRELRDVQAIATTLQAGPDGLPPGVMLAFDHAQWPEPTPVRTGALTGSPVSVLSYTNSITVYLPLLVSRDAAPGHLTVPFGLDLQVCNESTCLAPETLPLSVELDVVAPGSAAPNVGGADPALFAAFDPTVWAALAAKGPTAGAGDGSEGVPERTSRFDFFGWEFHISSSAYILILGIAFIAGVIMNFTPCVLPVVPLKVMSLQQQAGSPGKLAVLSVVYCLGILATFAVLGLLAFGLGTGGRRFDWGQIFSYGWFSLAMAAIVATMAVGMMGLFTIRLPQAVYMVNPSHDSLHGNFLFGVLTAILAVPCTGPLLGATLAWVQTQSAFLGLATFVVMGMGMAFPYALLLAFPRLIDRLPRTGPGSELLKQVLGIFMLAVAAFLATNAIHVASRGWIVGGLVSLAWVWAIIGGWRMLRTVPGKVRITVAAAVMLLITAGATWALTRPGPTDWLVMRNQPDSDIRAAIDKARSAGKTAVVDFTADWCANCHVIESLTLDSAVGRAVLARADVAPIQVDLSHAGQDQGWGVVREVSGGGGIPLIAIYRPGEGKPTYFQSFFKAADLERAVLGGPEAAVPPR